MQQTYMAPLPILGLPIGMQESRLSPHAALYLQISFRLKNNAHVQYQNIASNIICLLIGSKV